MAKPQAVPDSSSRESPAFWQKMFEASDKRRDRPNEHFARFSRWYRGDLRDVVDPKNTEDNLRWQSGLENMTNLATTASLADLLFRWPQFTVNTPYIAPPPVPILDSMGVPLPPQEPPTLFNPKFAKLRGARITYILRRTNYLLKARRALLDCLIGGMGVLKIVSDPEVVVDDDVLDAAKLEAQTELVDFLSKGVKMVAREGQIHSVHIEIKRQAMTQAQQGVIQLPKSAIKYLRNHIAHHEVMKLSERPTETIRANQHRILRINPLNFFYDPTVDDLDDCTWKGTRYLVRKADVVANPYYNERARLEVQNAQDKWQTTTFRPSIISPNSFDIPEDMVMCNEVFDLIDQKRYVYADGASVCLVEGEDRGDLKELQTSGPFNELIFMHDVMEAQGISPVAAFESEQSAATAIATAHVRTAIQCTPKTMYDMRNVNPDDAKRIWEGNTAEFIGIKPTGDQKKGIQDYFGQVPAAEINAQALEVLQSCRDGVNRRSGLGNSKMGGGEQSPTATGAALGADAASSISEDRGALVDAWQERTARTLARLEYFTPKSQVVETCGPEALEVWPEKMTLMEAANDIAIEVTPGSSRRRNTSVDQKQLLDGLTAVSQMPMFQGPAGSTIILQLTKRFFDDAGMTGIDFAPLEAEAQMLAMAPQSPAGGPEGAGGPTGPGAPGQATGGPPAKPNGHSPAEGKGVAPNDIAQGVANVGGGRVATGASLGDKIAGYRSAGVNDAQQRKR